MHTNYPGIRTPQDLYEKLQKIWCAYTCAPRMRDEWTPENPSLGQCSVTSFLAQDIFGGEVYGVPRAGGTVHCYNVIDGQVYDLTREQFGDEVLCYENNPEQFREVHFAAEEKRLRYEYLCRALERACGTAPALQYVLLDLDGTLIQSEYGVIDSVIYALDKFGITGESREKLKAFIGPSLYESFRGIYGFSHEDAELAVQYYREFYNQEGIYLSPLYDGVGDMLRDLRNAGRTLLVVTAKPQKMAEIVLHHTGIAEEFQAVVGPDLSEKKTDKASLIRKAFALLVGSDSEEAMSEIAKRSVMVGDRRYDVEGAVQAGIDAIGALYGYGSRQELLYAGAAHLAKTPEEVVQRVLTGSAAYC